MRYRACVVLGILSFASPVGAQDMSQQWAWCLNEAQAFTADQSIGGCTAVIQAARDVPANMAIAFNGRGNGHAAKGQPDRAIADYDQAIRLNPNYAAPHYNRGSVHLNTAQYGRARRMTTCRAGRVAKRARGDAAGWPQCAGTLQP